VKPQSLCKTAPDPVVPDWVRPCGDWRLPAVRRAKVPQVSVSAGRAPIMAETSQRVIVRVWRPRGRRAEGAKAPPPTAGRLFRGAPPRKVRPKPKFFCPTRKKFSRPDLTGTPGTAVAIFSSSQSDGGEGARRMVSLPGRGAGRIRKRRIAVVRGLLVTAGHPFPPPWLTATAAING
jgi:hypothetical protein